MIKLSDFARQQGVTPRAVQQLLKKYESQIEGHFERRGQNGTWFDETAQDFLRSKMLQKPIVVYDESASPLLSENQDLKHKADQLKDALTDAYKALADERAKSNETLLQLQLELAEYRLLAAGKEEAEARAKEAEAVTEALKEQADEANQKAADFEKLAIDARKREVEATTETEKAKAEAAELQAKLEKLQKRNLWQRIWNK